MSIRTSVVFYFVVAYALAWAVFVPMVVFHLPLPWIVLATLAPTVAALVVRRVAAGDFKAFRVAAGWTRTLVAAAAGVLLIVLAYVVMPALATADPRTLHWGILASSSVYNASTLLGGPLFEEPGWRGFALPRLEALLGPLPAAVLLGLLWAAWHLPLFWYVGWTTTPFWIYVLMVIGLSMLLAYATGRARYAVAVPIAMHAAFNTVSRFLNGLFAGTDGPHSPLPFELVMALGGLVMAAVIVAATRGRLGASIARHPASRLEKEFSGC